MIRPLLKKTKLYVTGGLRTTGGMFKAVESGACDGIGMGRPLAAEPYLCKEILEGRITRAIVNLVPLPLNPRALGTQLHQVGRGEVLVSNWSVEGEVKRWIEELERKMQRKEILPKVDSSRYAHLKPERGLEYPQAQRASDGVECRERVWGHGLTKNCEVVDAF